MDFEELIYFVAMEEMEKEQKEKKERERGEEDTPART